MAKKRFSEGAGPSQRQLRVGEVIRRGLSEILMRGAVHDPDLNRMSISVTEVSVTADLGIATVFIMPLGGKDYEGAIEGMVRNKGELRRLIGQKTKLKITPDFRFRIDEVFDRMDHTRKLFESDAVKRDLNEG